MRRVEEGRQLPVSRWCIEFLEKDFLDYI